MMFWNKKKNEMDSFETKELKINGFTCIGCSNHVIRDLKSHKEVHDVSIPNWENGKTKITFHEGSALSDSKIDDIIRNAG